MSKKDGRAKNGGKRVGSGRKVKRDKKETVILYIYKSVIEAYNGKSEMKRFFYGLINKEEQNNDNNNSDFN